MKKEEPKLKAPKPSIDISISLKLDKQDEEVAEAIGMDEEKEYQPGMKETGHFPADFEAEEDARVLLESVQIKKDKTRFNMALECLKNKDRAIKSLTDVKSKYARLVSEDKESS